jgi:3-oxoacyl-(acyl-carrier-protein) synthase
MVNGGCFSTFSYHHRTCQMQALASGSASSSTGWDLTSFMKEDLDGKHPDDRLHSVTQQLHFFFHQAKTRPLAHTLSILLGATPRSHLSNTACNAGYQGEGFTPA